MDDDDYGDAPDADLAAALEAAERTQARPTAAPAPVPPVPPPTRQQPAPATGKPAVQQPVPQKLRPAGSSVIVNSRQKGNPILTYIKNVPWEYGDIIPDYVVGASTCALFLSLKYHRLHPEYLYTRLKPLTNAYTLRLLLVLVDIDTHADPLRELTRTCLLHNLTLILSWSAPEAGRYLETYKMYEHASPAPIMERASDDPATRVVDVLAQVRSVNRTDAVALVSNFGTVRGAVNASAEEVVMVQGWGQRKVERWERAVGAPFRRGGARGVGVGVGVGPMKSREVRAAAERRRGRVEARVGAKLGIGGGGVEGEGEGGKGDEMELWVVEDDEEALLAVAEMEVAERRRKLEMVTETETGKGKGKGKEQEQEQEQGVDRPAAELAAPDDDESAASGIMDALTKLRERG
ncbi:restriction endonuclease type II-like protein [Morchella snyderi]|nr:restriction endonuclease type II-like protein [Morchella snyderi]